MFVKAEKRLLQMDWLLLGQIGLILGLNLIILSSASANVVPEQPYYYVQKQLLWMSIGLAVMIGAAFFDYRQYRRLIPVIYLLLLGLLVGVLFTAAKNNTHRWFDLGFMDFQPSELAKIILVLVCACFLAQRKNHINRPSTLLGAALGMGIPAVLILIEPDLGSALLIGVLLVVMLGLAGLDKKYLLLLLLLLLLLAGGLFGILYQASAGFSHNISDTDLPAWLPLQGYQAMRLIIFINPYMDSLGAGYHIIQSEIAVGSGGITGKGYGQGTQVQGNFLPYHHTDFIFSVVGEEFGFCGAAVLILLYLSLLLRILHIAGNARDQFGALLAGGIATLFALQILINIGMTIGLMPITGIPLPLLSYGGSSILMNMLALGMVLSVQRSSATRIF